MVLSSAVAGISVAVQGHVGSSLVALGITYALLVDYTSCIFPGETAVQYMLLMLLALELLGEGNGKGKCIYIAHFMKYLTLKAMRHGSQSVLTCNYTNACLYLVSVHQMAPPQTKVADI